jgi:hypothetical protein
MLRKIEKWQKQIYKIECFDMKYDAKNYCKTHDTSILCLKQGADRANEIAGQLLV